MEILEAILKALEQRSVRRVGGVRAVSTDVWIIGTSTEDLRAAVEHSLFREDLYKRLAQLDLLIPPLRQRSDDILLLAEHFLARVCAESNVPPKSFALDARRALLAYHWPGNVREVKAVTERAASLSTEKDFITAAMLALPID